MISLDFMVEKEETVKCFGSGIRGEKGYYTSKYEYPLCNHTEGVTERNIGYTKGITANGVPFEAELFEKEEVLTMAVIIPAIFNDAYEVREEEEYLNEQTELLGMHYKVKSFDYSVLDIGMVDDIMEENIEIVRDYVDFLVHNKIVSFASDLLNGAVMYRVDRLGNNLAKILITMCEGEEFLAYTDLDFGEFPKIHKSKMQLGFKVISKKDN